MDGRENLKIILTSGFATSLFIIHRMQTTQRLDIQTSQAPKNGYGRTPDEMEKDKRSWRKPFYRKGIKRC